MSDQTPERYSDEDYQARCRDLDLAVTWAEERIEEWDQVADPHGWWHERPQLIALVSAVQVSS